MTTTYALGETPCGCTVRVPEEAYVRRVYVERPCDHDRRWSVEIIPATIQGSFAAKAAFIEVIE